MKNISNSFWLKTHINCLGIGNNENIFNSLYDTPKAVLGEIFNSLTIYITKIQIYTYIYNEYPT